MNSFLSRAVNRRASQLTRGRRRYVVFGGLILLILAAPVGAQESEKLTLRSAVTLALQNSREVKLAQVQYNVALGEVRVLNLAVPDAQLRTLAMPRGGEDVGYLHDGESDSGRAI